MEKEVKPIAELILRNQLRPGIFFTHNGAFFCKGLSKFSNGYPEIIPPDKMPRIRLKLSISGLDYALYLPYHPSHLTSASARSELSGKKRLFVLGLVTNIDESSIEAKPYIIGNLIAQGKDLLAWENTLWQRQREIYFDEIDNFSRAKSLAERRIGYKELGVLKSISEKEIKNAFAEIINEPTVPKDWAGEKSDLFSTMVRIGGKNYSTAFVLKGPSKFHPMKMSDLGKNGDQIVRLYDEPAELLILQHCHTIENPVRVMMRAFAENIRRPRMFCLIDGFATLRILKAYKKCGQKPDDD
ncbi:MAG: hypothetical protein K8T10_13775 [Candidatus Eremiobacteraeota bacterium]|nr:hypothetical protein [Candidatus Eremiobacteraeota bacterium]